jgi:GT2 family glycosyltransferase
MSQAPSTRQVGILILNYHQPEMTLDCVRRLLEIEGPETCVIWLENDAASSWPSLEPILASSNIPWCLLDADRSELPPPGQVGVLRIEENLGYAAGNNAGLQFLQRHGVEFAWVMNNDTLLQRGSSRDLVEAAHSRPEVALWGMWVADTDAPSYLGLVLQKKDFAAARVMTASEVESDPMSFINGCAMFFRTDEALEVGGIPEIYFMYYEDPAFTWEFRQRGRAFSVVDSVEVLHLQSVTSGHRSRFMEYYCRRNRWHFIQKYCPDQLPRQKWLFFVYQMQKLFFRLRFDRIQLEWRAYQDFKNGRMGRVTGRF